jgi:hypothetical protein
MNGVGARWQLFSLTLVSFLFIYMYVIFFSLVSLLISVLSFSLLSRSVIYRTSTRDIYRPFLSTNYNFTPHRSIHISLSHTFSCSTYTQISFPLLYQNIYVFLNFSVLLYILISSFYFYTLLITHLFVFAPVKS